MIKIKTFFACMLLMLLTLTSCDYEPTERIWYGRNGLVVESKATNDKNYGKWKYTIRDNFDLILIRTTENWNVGDTLFINKP